MTLKRRSLTTSRGALAYTIAHRPRVTRRMHLELDADGELQVVVPHDWPAFYTHRVLEKNFAYVQRFLNRARPRLTEPLRYVDGSQHLLAGEILTLNVSTGTNRRACLTLVEDQLLIELADPAESRIQAALRTWYLEQARALFAQRLELMQRRAPWARDCSLKLALRRMKRTWGTCNSKGLIRLNTHLVKAPERCLDYVICHELCHLQEMNHGPRFYHLQNTIWPDWQHDRRHLRDQGNRYTQE